jgi:hypothetical protein
MECGGRVLQLSIFFDEMDVDHSGSIEISELESVMR